MTRILVVDDSATQRRSNIAAFKAAFPNTTQPLVFVEAESVSEAQNKVSSDGPFDLILTDHNMPEQTGLQFLEALPNPPPTVFVTKGDEIAAIRDQASQAGAAGFVATPATAESFRSTLTPILGTKI